MTDEQPRGQGEVQESGTPMSISTLSTRPPATPLASSHASETSIDNVFQSSSYDAPINPPTPGGSGYHYHQPAPYSYVNSAHNTSSAPKQYSPSGLPRHLFPHVQPQSASSSRRNSFDSDLSLAEEGEATPLLRSLAARSSGLSGQSRGTLGEDDGEAAASDADEGDVVWYEGKLFVAGVKLALLFLAFTGVVVGTFWYGMPPVDPCVYFPFFLA